MLLPVDFKVWLNCEPTDMRKAINGLSLLVVESFKKDPQTGNLFIFYNRRKDLIKMLYWHYNGFCLFQKRLEQSCFKIPKRFDGPMTVSEKQLSKLIEGLHFINKSEASYDVFY